jgi:hypothetical protein
MVIEAEKTNTEESGSGFPEVPDEAIVKPQSQQIFRILKEKTIWNIMIRVR